MYLLELARNVHTATAWRTTHDHSNAIAWLHDRKATNRVSTSDATARCSDGNADVPWSVGEATAGCSFSDAATRRLSVERGCLDEASALAVRALSAASALAARVVSATPALAARTLRVTLPACRCSSDLSPGAVDSSLASFAACPITMRSPDLRLGLRLWRVAE